MIDMLFISDKILSVSECTVHSVETLMFNTFQPVFADHQRQRLEIHSSPSNPWLKMNVVTAGKFNSFKLESHCYKSLFASGQFQVLCQFQEVYMLSPLLRLLKSCTSVSFITSM